MSLKNNFLSVLAVAIAVVGFSTFTLAQDSSTTAPNSDRSEKRMKGEGRGEHQGKFGREGQGGRHGGMMRMLHGLDLTEAQKTQIHAIFEANKPDQATREEAKTLAQAKRAGTITPEQQERLTALKTQGMEKMRSVHGQIIAILTPDQVTKLEQKKAEMQQRMQNRKMRHQQGQGTATDKSDN